MSRLDHAPYLIAPGEQVDLATYRTSAGRDFKNKSQGKEALAEDTKALSDAQRVLYASSAYSLLIILQGMDASGKDGTIRHVMSEVNPQGCHCYSFGAPSEEDLQHHFLWRPTRYLPGRGYIGIFNRSYYEEVLIVRVHPHWLDAQHLPPNVQREDIWQSRFDDIRAFERTLHRNGTRVLKFFLHISKGQQKRRFLKRLDRPDKHWKFSAADIREREYWDQYRAAYEDMLSHTSTDWAPWYVIPGDDKWFARALVADIITARIEELSLSFPVPSDEERVLLQEARAKLENEAE